MNALRKIIAIAWKDTLVRFSSLSEMMYLIILPLIFIFILSGGPRGPKQDGRVILPIADDAGSAASRALIAAIDQSATVRSVPANGKRALGDGDAALLIIPASFEADLARGGAALDLRLKPNDLNAIAAQRAVATAAGRISRATEAARASADDANRLRPFDSPEARQAWYEASLRDAQAFLAAAPAPAAAAVARPRPPCAPPLWRRAKTSCPPAVGPTRSARRLKAAWMGGRILCSPRRWKRRWKTVSPARPARRSAPPTSTWLC